MIKNVSEQVMESLKIEDPTSATCEFGGSACKPTASSRRSSQSFATVDVRGAKSTFSNRGNLPCASSTEAVRDFIGSSHSESDSSRIRFRSGMGRCIESSTIPTSIITPTDSHCSTSGKLGSNHCGATGERSSSIERSGDSTGDAGASAFIGDGGSESQHRIMGAEVHQLGKEVAGSSLPGSIRAGPRLRVMDCSTCQHLDSSHEGFSSILHQSTTTGAGDVEDIPESLIHQNFYELLLASFVTGPWEERRLREATKDIHKKESIDLLEVYASDQSRLTQAIRDRGGRSLRFTKEDGDLSTFEGQVKLIRWVLEYSPKHLWLAPECLPWCAWNKFNRGRSPELWDKIHDLQEESRVHLRLCNLLLKLQKYNGRHCHLENPAESDLWKQPELWECMQNTLPARFDQCQMGLRHPQNHKLLRKRTIVRTTSKEVHQLLDDRLCNGQHVHSPIAGSCRVDGKRMLVSRFAAFYPTGLAKRIAKVLVQQHHQHVDFPLLPVIDLDPTDEESSIAPREPLNKKLKTVHEESVRTDQDDETTEQPSRKEVRKQHLKGSVSNASKTRDVENRDHPWTHVFQRLKQVLPRVGAKEFRAGDEIFAMIQELCTNMNVVQVKACKGVEKYLVGDPLLPIRKTFVLRRFNQTILELGQEKWTELT